MDTGNFAAELHLDSVLAVKIGGSNADAVPARKPFDKGGRSRPPNAVQNAKRSDRKASREEPWRHEPKKIAVTHWTC